MHSDDFRRMLGPALAPLLLDIDPLRQIRDLLASYEQHLCAIPPTAARASHERDVFLLRLLMSNPLPLEYFARLTFVSGNAGSLYKDNGAWRIRADHASHACNRTALHWGPYDQAVDPVLDKAVETYLCDVRPRLFRARELAAVFLPSERCSVANNRSLKAAIANGFWNPFLMSQSLMRTVRQVWPALHRVHPEQLRWLAAAAHLRTCQNDVSTLIRITHGNLPPGLVGAQPAPH